MKCSLIKWITIIFTVIKVEYHVNEYPLKKSEKIEYVGQSLMNPMIKLNNTLPH